MGFGTIEVRNCLLSKFKFVRQKTHKRHEWLLLLVPGIDPVTTMLSHGRKEIPKTIRSKMATQLRVNLRFFEEMVSCTKTSDEYRAKLTS